VHHLTSPVSTNLISTQNARNLLQENSSRKRWSPIASRDVGPASQVEEGRADEEETVNCRCERLNVSNTTEELKEDRSLYSRSQPLLCREHTSVEPVLRRSGTVPVEPDLLEAVRISVVSCPSNATRWLISSLMLVPCHTWLHS
jgi:hypothetical protein